MTRTVYAERSITLTRHLKAPRDLVWRAWTDPTHLAQWFGPQGFTNTVSGEVRVGGATRIVMHGPKGTPYDGDFPCSIVWREIVPGQKLVFENDALGADGATIIEGRTVVTFAEEDGGTRLVMETTGKAVAEFAKGFLDGMEQGWSQSLDKLAGLLG